MLRPPWPDPTDPAAIRAHLAATRPDPTAVRSWAGRLLADRADHDPAPRLGGPDWRALPDHDPRKLHAALLAALAWLDDNTPAAIETRLRREADAQDHAVAARLKAAAVETAAGLRHAHRHGIAPTHAELHRRRNTYPCQHCHTTNVLWPATVCDTCTPTSMYSATTPTVTRVA